MHNDNESQKLQFEFQGAKTSDYKFLNQRIFWPDRYGSLMHEHWFTCSPQFDQTTQVYEYDAVSTGEVAGMARFEYFSAEGQACVDKVVDWKVSFTDSNDEILPLVQGTDAPCASSDSICKLSKLAKSISETFTISSGKESFEWTMDSPDASLMGE